jgi:hypothetical protein
MAAQQAAAQALSTPPGSSRLSGSVLVELGGPSQPRGADCCGLSGERVTPGTATTCSVLRCGIFVVGATRFDLSPDVRITAPDGNPGVLTLAYDTGKRRARAFVSLHGLDEHALARWQEALTEERDALHLPGLGPAQEASARLIHAALWRLFKAKKEKTAELRQLYFADWEGGARIVTTLLGKYIGMMQRGSQDLTTLDAAAFATLLAAAASDAAVRVVLLRLPLREGVLAGAGKAACADFETYVGDVQKRVAAWSDYNRALFLRHHRHPAETAAAPVRMCAPEEVAWFESLFAPGTRDPVELSLPDFQAATSAACAFLLASEYAARGEADALCHVVRTVPKEDCRKYAYPSLLFTVPHKDQQQLLAAFTAKGAVDGAFYRKLLTAGLTTARAAALRSFLFGFLFEPGTRTYSAAALVELTTAMQDFPVTLFKAIHQAGLVDATIDIQSDLVHTLLEIVFGLEADVRTPGWSNLATLSRWLAPGAEQAERKAMFMDVYGRGAVALYVQCLYQENQAALWPAYKSDGSSDGAAAKPAGGFGPASSVPVANVYERSKDEVSNLLLGLVKVGLQMDTAIITSTLAKLRGWEETAVGRGTALRGQIVDAIVQTPAFAKMYTGDNGGFPQLMRDGALLNRDMHFSSGVLKAMCLPTTLAAGEDVSVVFSLVSAGLKLEQWDVLDTSVRDVWERSCIAEDRKAQLQRIVLRTLRRQDADLFSTGTHSALISISDLDECACYATEAVRMLSSAPLIQEKMNRLFDYYLKESPPDTWGGDRGLFKSAETVAFFLKYLDREDLPKAFLAFKDRNAGNVLFAGLIWKAESVFTTPIITSDEVQLTDPNAITTFIARLGVTGKANADPLLGTLQQLAAEWMQKTFVKLGTAMAPRNAQIIAFLLCAQWTHARVNMTTPDEQRTLVARVGTGEGKSLIIAMIAVYCAKVLKKKVHVLQCNEGLLRREHEDLKDFFAKFGLTSEAKQLSAGADIAYCLQRDIDGFYQNGVGRNPFDNTVLLVDEVDALIVDEKPNTPYVKQDAVFTAGIKGLFDALTAGGGSAPALSGDPMYAKARGAYQQAQGILRAGQNAPNGYQIVGGEYKFVGADGKVKDNAYMLAMEYLNHKEGRSVPTVQTRFFVQSTPHMLRQYSAIIGLSGSLGSPAEIEFLSTMYGAKTIDCPPFLDTCKGVKKSPPTLVADEVQVHAGDAAHRAAVVALARKHSETVPVVVLCNTQQAARSMLAAFPQADRTRGAVQLYLEHDADGKRMDSSAIVQKATQPCGAGKDKVWRITVSDLFGGRGTDYRIADKSVDDAGGLLVVASFIPESKREWVQWQGRTARSDRAGQYAVVLERGAEPVRGDASMLTKHVMDPAAPGVAHKKTLIDELLARRDVKCLEQLETLKASITSGMCLNEMCDRFWVKEGGMTATWPTGAAQRSLRDYLSKTDIDSAPFDSIAAFAVSAGLATTVEAYKRSSAYHSSDTI